PCPQPAARCHIVAGGCKDGTPREAYRALDGCKEASKGNASDPRSRVCGPFLFLTTPDLEKRVPRYLAMRTPIGRLRHCGRQMAEEGLQETILSGIGGFADCSISELMIAIALWDGASPPFGMGWSR